MEGLVILIVTLIAFATMTAWVIFKLVKGPKLPDGHQFEIESNGNKTILIVDKALEGAIKNTNGNIVSWIRDGKIYDGKSLAKKCAAAFQATELAFLQKGIEKADEGRIVFLFSTDDAFEKGLVRWPTLANTAAAYSTSLTGIFGTKRTSMAVMRARYFSMMAEKGQPVIHELVHILNKAASGDYGHNHSDPNLWIGPGGKDSVESISVQKWKELMGMSDD